MRLKIEPSKLKDMLTTGLIAGQLSNVTAIITPNGLSFQDISLGTLGVYAIYTTYTDEQKIIKEGEIVALETLPKWIDVQMLETDVVIHVFVEQSYKTNERKFIGVVDSSKYKLFPTGKRADITGKGLKALMKDA